MSLTIQTSAVLNNNNLLLPDIHFTVERGEPVAIQSDIEWLESFHSLFLSSSPFIAEQPKNVFVFLQSDGLYTRLTPRQHIRFWKKLYGQPTNEENVLAICELSQVADKRLKHLSATEQRRLHFARCLIMPCEACLFDQPIIHADRQTKLAFYAMLEQLSDRFVIMTATSLEEAIQLGKPYRLNERGLHEVDDGTDTGQNQTQATPFHLEKISAKVDDKYILFDPLEIDYVESNEGGSWLHVNNETFAAPLPLKEMEERLRPFGFFRCHRSYVVNLQRVREIIIWSKNSYSLSLNDREKSSIPLSKGNYATLKDMLNM
ncbi:LytTR family transcriptional regulator DNA-binding domain-containing protein [Salicibibacter cibarius]|uniref:LytTR family transcriptional regulator DNA-binding domain-containing protein n=1 Tax=Salicibibacter cibarius TaxID=2743000 RepID=A0A7T7CAW0_9BACI|nr:LytTR family transcriptional regulator DNA-binding domain-containing protein [Salicibibacter cibarius]QQK75317.1 LytTR family transcriptional regulator DNA-binding domain-containing protein [Salicibibacter cibarius]